MGSSIAPHLPAHSRHSKYREACTEGRKDPKPIPARLEDEKEDLECHENDDNKYLPFSNLLKAMEVSIKFRMPSMEKYNRGGDDSNHINVYKTKLQDSFLTLKCKNFHTTLTSDAKR
ncbi:hypothetical protein Adt_05888 [Abeliophyllum distichum]|uniref:Uncharacterized protein n=1 Tax=Abeliophyllum distichum TaxID=126358 RepID=A0ABD1V5S1_9LAMI